MKKSLLIIASLLVCLLSNANTREKGSIGGKTCVGTHKKGLISGETWKKSKSPYVIDSAIFVASLTIEPGVEIKFCGNYVFEVGGILTAIGTSCDSIKFTSDTTASWKGILFQNSLPGSVMAWCVVENANTSGIRIFDSYPKIYNCDIRNNTSAHSGGGLKISNTKEEDLEISYCTIEGNVTSASLSNGGGVWVNAKHGIARFKNCTIKNNQCTRYNGYAYGGGAFAQGNVEFVLCTIQDNLAYGESNALAKISVGYGGGIYIKRGSVNLFNTIINQNHAGGYAPSGLQLARGYAYGGGISIDDGYAFFSNSIITNNTATSSHGTYGGGLFVNSVKTTTENCTFADNNPHGIYNNTDTINVINSIIYFNNNNNEQVTGNIDISYSDVQGGYTGKGNINFSPLFQGNGVYKIVSPSLCIDAGNPAQQYKDACFPPSLGNTRNDMGAHGGPQACTWNDCGYTAAISTVKAGTSCNDGKIKVDVFGTLNSIKIKLYDASNNLLSTFKAGSCVVTHTFSNLSGGKYVIKISNGNGCEQEYTASVKCSGSFAESQSSLENMNASVANDLVVYPNPTTGAITLKFNQSASGGSKIILTDITGRRILEKTIYSSKGENVYHLNIGNLANGSYLLQIKTSAGEKVLKVVKE